MSFQITILKVLAGSAGGRLSLADLRHDVSILISSGRDWTDRTKRMAARAPDLDIFGQALVFRDATGWLITDAGREVIAMVEKPVSPPAPSLIETQAAIDPPVTTAQPFPLIGVNTRRSRRSRPGRQAARSAVA